MSVEILLFQIDSGFFGIPTSDVQEVLRAAALSPLPEYADCIEGALNLRGEIIPVVEGRAVLLKEHQPISPNHHMLVVKNGGMVLAIRVDRALELAQIASLSESNRSSNGKLVGAVVNTQYGPTSILDTAALVKLISGIPSQPTGGEND